MEDLPHCVVQNCVPFGAAAQKKGKKRKIGFHPLGLGALADQPVPPRESIFQRFTGDVEPLAKFVHVSRIFDVVTNDGRSDDLTRTNPLHFFSTFEKENK